MKSGAPVLPVRPGAITPWRSVATAWFARFNGGRVGRWLPARGRTSPTSDGIVGQTGACRTGALLRQKENVITDLDMAQPAGYSDLDHKPANTVTGDQQVTLP